MLASLAIRQLRQQLQRHANQAVPERRLWVTAPRVAGRPLPCCVPIRSMTASTAVQGVIAAKRKVRDEVKTSLRQLSEAQMAEESRAIAQHLLASSAFRDAPHAIIYVHCSRLREVDTTTILEAALEGHKRLYVPRVQDKDANMHFLHFDGWQALHEVPPFGIREPLTHYGDGREREDVLQVDEPLELIVMPGLAFDRSGRRLGRGGGYYDKFIHAAQDRAAKRGWAPPLLVALSYRAQLVDQVPVEPHDVGVDAIVTADGAIACTPAGAAALPPAAA